MRIGFLTPLFALFFFNYFIGWSRQVFFEKFFKLGAKCFKPDVIESKVPQEQLGMKRKYYEEAEVKETSLRTSVVGSHASVSHEFLKTTQDPHSQRSALADSVAEHSLKIQHPPALRSYLVTPQSPLFGDQPYRKNFVLDTTNHSGPWKLTHVNKRQRKD